MTDLRNPRNITARDCGPGYIPWAELNQIEKLCRSATGLQFQPVGIDRELMAVFIPTPQGTPLIFTIRGHVALWDWLFLYYDNPLAALEKAGFNVEELAKQYPEKQGSSPYRKPTRPDKSADDLLKELDNL